VLSVLKEVLKLADVVVFYLPMNSKFSHQLLLRARTSKARLENDFARVDLLSFFVCEYVASSKGTLAQQFPLHVHSFLLLPVAQFYYFSDFPFVFKKYFFHF